MRKTPRIRTRDGQRGASLIEFALVLPIMLVVTFLVVDFGRAFFMRNVLEQAAREGARQLAVGASTDSILARVTPLANLSGAGSISFDLQPSYGSAQVRSVVTGQLRWLYPGLLKFLGASGDSMTLTGACTMRREY